MVLKVSVENIGSCRKVMYVNVPADAISQGYSEVITAFSNVAKVPGFRHGKAPAKLVEQRYSKKITEEVKERLVPRFYREALQEKSIIPVAIVAVDNIIFKKEEGLEFNVTIDVAPEFKLPKYKKILIREGSVEVFDHQIDSAITRLREQFSRLEDVTGRTAKEGDFLKIDYAGTCDSRPISEIALGNTELERGKDFIVRLGEPEFIPGIARGLDGADLNESRKLSIEFPDNFRVETLVGRKAEYLVTVKAIQERIIPELEETHFRQLGAESLDSLRVRIREELFKNASEREKESQREQIAKFLLEKTQLEIPQSVVDEETRLAVRNIVEDVARRGATQEQIAEKKESIMSTATNTSKERVKLSYILNSVAEHEGVVIKDSEVDDRIEVMAKHYQMTPEALRKELSKRNSLEGLRSEMRASRAMELVHSFAKIKR